LAASDSTFAERLAYVRWLRSRGRPAPETDAELAGALGVTSGWIRKWKLRPDAPEGRTQMAAIEKALHPTGVSVHWLFDNQGTAPEPDQWDRWLEARKQPKRARAQLDAVTAEHERQATRTKPRPRAARGGRPGN
jgi:transcriptional regulator with XRE-family HTH domain